MLLRDFKELGCFLFSLLKFGDPLGIPVFVFQLVIWCVYISPSCSKTVTAEVSAFFAVSGIFDGLESACRLLEKFSSLKWSVEGSYDYGRGWNAEVMEVEIYIFRCKPVGHDVVAWFLCWIELFEESVPFFLYVRLSPSFNQPSCSKGTPFPLNYVAN